MNKILKGLASEKRRWGSGSQKCGFTSFNHWSKLDTVARYKKLSETYVTSSLSKNKKGVGNVSFSISLPHKLIIFMPLFFQTQDKSVRLVFIIILRHCYLALDHVSFLVVESYPRRRGKKLNKNHKFFTHRSTTVSFGSRGTSFSCWALNFRRKY